MALLPSLTTSNRVTGSPPSPLCWATPFAFPRPLAMPTALSIGDFRGFLLDVCGDRYVNQTGRKQITQTLIFRQNFRCTQTQTYASTQWWKAGKSQSLTHVYRRGHLPGLVFQASLSSSCLSPLDLPSHSCSYLSPLHLLPQTHWMSP